MTEEARFIQSGPRPSDSVDLLNYRHVLGWNQAIDVAVAPEMRDWLEIFNRAASNLRSKAWYEKKRKKAA